MAFFYFHFFLILIHILRILRFTVALLFFMFIYNFKTLIFSVLWVENLCFPVNVSLGPSLGRQRPRAAAAWVKKVWACGRHRAELGYGWQTPNGGNVSSRVWGAPVASHSRLSTRPSLLSRGAHRGQGGVTEPQPWSILSKRKIRNTGDELLTGIILSNSSFLSWILDVDNIHDG